MPILSFLNTELRIVVSQFEGLFEKVFANCALEWSEHRALHWAELDTAFKNAIIPRIPGNKKCNGMCYYHEANQNV